MTKFAKVYWAALFAVGAALTVTVNGAYAKGALAIPGTFTAMFVAMAPPAVFASLAEGYYLVRRAVPPHVHRLVLWSVGGLAAATFAVSYMTQRAFVLAKEGVPLPVWVGWVIPGMLDTLVAVSGFILYIIAAHGDHPAVKPEKQTHDHHRGADVADAATGTLTAVLGRWTRKLEAPVGGAVGGTTGGTTGGIEAAIGVPVVGSEAAVGGDREVPGRADIGGLIGGSAEGFTGGSEPAVGGSIGDSDSAIGGRRQVPVGAPVEGDPYRAAARWMRETGDVRKSEKDIVKVIAALEDGLSHNAIKTRFRVSPGTTGTIADGWRQWQSRNRQLEVVG
jgi:hypothetical protein